MTMERRGALHGIARILYQPYKWLVFVPLLVLSTCFFVGLGVIIIFLLNDRVANRTTGVWWARFNSLFTPMLVTVLGREHIKRKQSYVVVSNHQSHFDIFVLYGWLGIDLKWVIKKELRKVPVFGYAAEKGGNILIDRRNPREAYADLERAKARITGGTSIIILPEGTRSRDGSLGEFKKGAFVLARSLGLPILPVSITGTRLILPPGTFDLLPGRAVMRIHEAIEEADYESWPDDRLVAEVRERIRRGMEEHA